jgi:dolichyl-phosphate-mannose-protein mannosyltransferase
MLTSFTLVFLVFPFFYWLLGAAWVLAPRQWSSASKRLLAVAWLGLSILTPFYHPYARLWLPLHFLGWIMAASLINQESPARRQNAQEAASALKTKDYFGISIRRCITFAAVLLAIELVSPITFRRPTLGPGDLPGPLASSDWLRNAVKQAVADLPADTAGLRLLARPPVAFYLGGRVPARVEPDLARLLTPADPRLWALVDLAQLRQERDLKVATAELLDRWELVREYPAYLSLPALLDVDPGAACAGKSESIYAPLWLLRLRTTGPT